MLTPNTIIHNSTTSTWNVSTTTVFFKLKELIPKFPSLSQFCFIKINRERPRPRLYFLFHFGSVVFEGSMNTCSILYQLPWNFSIIVGSNGTSDLIQTAWRTANLSFSYEISQFAPSIESFAARDWHPCHGDNEWIEDWQDNKIIELNGSNDYGRNNRICWLLERFLLDMCVIFLVWSITLNFFICWFDDIILVL